MFGGRLQIFNALAGFPHDVLELFMDKSDFVLSKMAGSSLDVYLVRAELIDEAHVDLDRPLNVVWSSPRSVEEVEKRLGRFDVRPIHITMGERPDAVPISTLTAAETNRLVLDLVSRAATVSHQLAGFWEYAKQQTPIVREEGPLPLAPWQHNCTIPLLSVLRVYGYRIENGKPIPPSEEVDQHIEGMAELVRLIDGLRHASGLAHHMRKNDAILYCPSSYTYLYRADSQHWNALYRKLDRERRSFLKNALIRNKGYGNANFLVASGGKFNPYQDKVVGPLLAMRQSELALFTYLVAVAAANQFVPAIRLPNAVMLHHDRLRNIYALINSTAKNRTIELNRKVADYSRAVLEEMGAELRNAAFGGRERVLAVCDFPIEWLSLELVPAMFRLEISRVPSTPGNVTAQVLLSGQRILTPTSALSDVLIIRSFEPTDPIRDHLMFAVSKFAENDGLANISLRVVDVASEEELVAALGEFEGMMTIFDCHGNHGGEEGHAWLQIGNDKVDVWQLANRCRIPPIVILAACSTHALDGSHASVANGLLRCGALSVIGTFAPVDATHMGITVARLLYRMSAFVPLATKRAPRSWRDIVTGFLRMSYVTDVLRDLQSEVGSISSKQYHQIHTEANNWINRGDSDWLEKLFAAVMSAMQIGQEQLQDLWSKRYQFVDTMLLVQLGRPENILIVNDAEIDEEASEAS